MKKNIQWVALTCVLFSNHLFAAQYKREPESCFPISKTTYEAGNKSVTGLSEREFNQIIDNAANVITPEIKRLLNKNLIIEKRWADATVDAFATRDDQNNPVIVVNGGLARHPQMTRDAFLLLICHEVGHHLGGAPKMLRGNSNLRSWSSAEGQADYYATSKCLPLFFKSGLDNKSTEGDLDPNDYKMALAKCRDNTCARITLAGLAASNMFSSLVDGTPEPKLTVSDSTRVEKTLYKHPNPQCRLDTYLSGASCELGPEEPFDSVDPKVGACVKDSGARPSCWFQLKDF
ncbi:MAG: hypothetical protein KBD76_12835 [Bacteriovorax sp.]|nr:hypothetical protein [Bacteriovorax sp.]